ncbi:MAG: hypothetical protein QXP98_07610 [Thermoproteus sp.]
MNCQEEYERLARYCAERDGELTRYKLLASEYLEDIKRLTMLLSSAVGILRLALNNGCNISEQEIKKLEEEVKYYYKLFLI